jgi:hypothetical protein
MMMTALLLYAYCCGIYSSRRIARACIAQARQGRLSILSYKKCPVRQAIRTGS